MDVFDWERRPGWEVQAFNLINIEQFTESQPEPNKGRKTRSVGPMKWGEKQAGLKKFLPLQVGLCKKAEKRGTP